MNSCKGDQKLNLSETIPVDMAFPVKVSLALKSIPQQFYRASEFKVNKLCPSFPHLPADLLISRNYFSKKWSGFRRVKDVAVVLEWRPESSHRAFGACGSEQAPWKQQEQEVRIKDCLDKIWPLFAADGEHLGAEHVRLITAAAVDVGSDFMNCIGEALDREGMRGLLSSNVHHETEADRFFVVLSLAEAETLRRIAHCKGGKDCPVFAGAKNASFALRSLVDWNQPLDEAVGFEQGKQGFQTQRAVQVSRFFNCETSFEGHQLNALLKAMCWEDPLVRERFFVSVGGCRRRALGDNWQAFSVAEVFRSSHEWDFLVKRLRGEMLKKKALTFLRNDISSLFARVDMDKSGDIDVKELSSALMSMFEIAPDEKEDLIQWFRQIDADRTGSISEGELSLFLGQLEHLSGQEQNNSIRRSLIGLEQSIRGSFGFQLSEIHREHHDFLQDVSASELKGRKDQQEKELEAKKQVEDSWAEAIEEQLGENPRLEDSGACAVFSFQQLNPPRFISFVGENNEPVQDKDPRLKGQNLQFWSLEKSAVVIQRIPLEQSEAATSDLNFVDRYSLTMWFCLPQLPSEGERLTLIHWGKPETDLYSDLPSGELYVWPDGSIAPEDLQEPLLLEEVEQMHETLSTDYLLQLKGISDIDALTGALSALDLHMGMPGLDSGTLPTDMSLHIWLQVDSCSHKAVGGVMGQSRCRFEGMWGRGPDDTTVKLIWYFQGATGNFEPYAELIGSCQEDYTCCEGRASTFNSLKDLFKDFRLSSQSCLGGLWESEMQVTGQEAEHTIAVATQHGGILQLALTLGQEVGLSGCVTALDIFQKRSITLAVRGRPDMDCWLGKVSSKAMEGTLHHAGHDIGAWSAKRIQNPSCLRLPSAFLQRAVRYSSNKMSASKTETLSFRQFSSNAPGEVGEASVSRKVYFEITLEESDSIQSVSWILESQPGREHAASLASFAVRKASLEKKKDSTIDPDAFIEEQLARRADVQFRLTSVTCAEGDVLGCLYDAEAPGQPVPEWKETRRERRKRPSFPGASSLWRKDDFPELGAKTLRFWLIRCLPAPKERVPPLWKTMQGRNARCTSRKF